MNATANDKQDDKRFIKRVTGGHVRSPRLDFAHIGPKLSTRKINEYIRAGYYGEAAQRKLLAADARQKNKQDQIKAKKRKINKLLDELGL